MPGSTASSVALAAAVAGRGLLGSPWSWSGLAGLCLGVAAGIALRGLIDRIRQGRGPGKGRRAGRGGQGRVPAHGAFPVASLVWLSFAILAAAGFLVFPAKAEAFSAQVLAWTGALALCGLVIGRFPRAGGLAFLGLGLAAAGFFHDATRGYVAFSGPVEVARLLPLSEAGGVWIGEFLIHGKDGQSGPFRLELEGREAALVVDRLELRGPATMTGCRRFYRIAGIADAAGKLLADFHPRQSLLDRFVPKASRGSFFVLTERLSSEALGLVALQPVAYGFRPAAAGGSGLIAAPADAALVLGARALAVEGLGN